MSTNRSRRIDPDTAEQLLGGAVGGPSAGQEASLTGPDARTGHTAVAHVLAAAAAPAVAGELAGEEAALAAFREARLAPAPAVSASPVRRRSMATATLARAFSTKAVAVVLGATALGGVAVAAGTGNLPSPLGGSGGSDHQPTVAGTSAPAAGSGTPGSGPGARQPAFGPSTGAPSAAEPSTGAAKPSSPGAPASGEARGGSVPSAQIALCRGFTDRTGKGERPRTLVTDPQFGALVAAAGGPDKVEEYCGEVLRRASDDDRLGATPQPRSSNDGTNGNANGTTGGNTGGGDGRSGGTGGKATATTPPVPVVPTLPEVHPKPDLTDKPVEASPKR
ncbi:hypothetical protein ACFVHB_02220 [Kitasatospora sp. NPDC127111]|uniref:hypothetical protein n=1 Tax=Kitasatospora sp. NPDC127111 TaxID=3345363 RepID=UPI0036367A6D